MKKISTEDYDKPIEDFNKKSYSKNKNFYLHTDMEFTIFKKCSFMDFDDEKDLQKENLIEEYFVNHDDNNKIICFNKNQNNYDFEYNNKNCLSELTNLYYNTPSIERAYINNQTNSNSTGFNTPLSEERKSTTPPGENKRLIFFKFLKCNEQKTDKNSFAIKSIKLVDLYKFEKLSDLKNYYKKLLIEIYKNIYNNRVELSENLDIDLWPEYDYKSILKENDGEILDKISEKENISLSLFISHGIVLMVNLKEPGLFTLNTIIAKELESAINKVFLKLIQYRSNGLLQENRQNIYPGQKVVFLLTDDEELVKIRIFKFLQRNNLKIKVLPENTIYLTEENNLYDSEKFANILNWKDIDIKKLEKKPINNLSKFVNCIEMCVEFDVKLSSYYTKFEIYDEFNRFKTNLVICNMQNLDNTENIIDHLYDIYLKNEFPAIEKNRFFLIWENHNAEYIKGILLNDGSNDNISQILHNDLSYNGLRIQALNEEYTIDKIIVFLIFSSRDGTRLKKPMVFFTSRDKTWNKLLLDILELIKSIFESKELTINQHTIRCYKYAIYNEFIIQKGEFINYNNEKLITENLKSNQIQLIVEAPNSSQNNNNLKL